MGEIVGAALVAHVPTIVLPEAERLRLNGGSDFTLVEGLHRIRREHLDRLRPDTIVVIDSHWFTTFEHVVTSHERRHGRFTSSELPRTMTAVPFDAPGDPELALEMAAVANGVTDTWVVAIDDPYLPNWYGTLNLLPFLQGDEAWVSVSVCQTATTDDFLLFGTVLAEAVRRTDRRVVVLASGGMSHKFLPLRRLRQAESASLENLHSPEAGAADQRVLDLWAAGDHRTVIEEMPAYLRFGPEGRFGHYLDMIGALGGAECTAVGTLTSEYEASVGTGQVDVWFERPEGGWTA